MAFRLFRNDALQKYRAQFDLAAQYAYLAAAAYDYETSLLSSSTLAGRKFLSDIVKQRSLGVVSGGSPMVGNGLAGQLAQMWANFDLVLRSRLGFNARDEFNRTFGLRWELFRIPNTPAFDVTWRQLLSGQLRPNDVRVVPDLNELPEYRQYCRPLQPIIVPNPAIIFEFPSTVAAGLNFFGNASTGDETLPSDRFAIKVHSYGVRFSGYPRAPLNTPHVNVYLVPVGADVQREPNSGQPREWHLLDQTLPVPFPISDAALSTEGWVPWDSIAEGSIGMYRRRLIPTVPACPSNDLQCADVSFKLTGRSIWNRRWMLIIPGSELQGSNPANGINVFINGTSSNPTGVTDIKLVFKCYGYSGSAAASSFFADEPPPGERDGLEEPTVTPVPPFEIDPR